MAHFFSLQPNATNRRLSAQRFRDATGCLRPNRCELSIGVAAATHTLANVPALPERNIAGSAPELRCLDDRLMDRGADDE